MKFEWISVEDALPKIPAKRYGIQVLTVKYDPIYAECCPPHTGQFVQSTSYGIVNYEKMPIFVGSGYPDGQPAFMELYTGGKRGDNSWGPVGDAVTHWAYMPKPPPVGWRKKK